MDGVGEANGLMVDSVCIVAVVCTENRSGLVVRGCVEASIESDGV